MSRRQYSAPAPATAGPPDDSGCPILHVDMDAFYASVSLLDHPELVGTPVIVGGAGTRSVVLSATYEARASGVTSAMPMSRALRLCPTATVLPPQHDRYAAVSKAVFATFRSVTPLVEGLSLDEAFLDVSGARRLLGPPTTIAELIRAQVLDEQGVTCSVGIAPTKFVAKLASGMAKPDGVLVVPAADVVSFLHQLPVGALWGVGEKTEEALTRLGLRTVADIAHTPRATLQRALGDVGGAHLHDLSWGRDPRRVEPTREEKSVGADETFPYDVDDPDYIRRELLRLSDKVAGRLRAAGLSGRTVTLKVRFADFTTITRARTLREPTDVSREIFTTVSDLYAALGLQRARLRLVGVRMSSVVETSQAPIQGLLDEPEFGWRDADRAIDRAQARFGKESVTSASLLPSRATRRTPGPGQHASGPS